MEIFPRASFYQYISTICQANIENILYLLLRWVNKAEIDDVVLFTQKNTVKIKLFKIIPKISK